MGVNLLTLFSDKFVNLVCLHISKNCSKAVVNGEKPSEEMCTTEKWYKDCCYWNMKKGLTGECLPKSKKQYFYFFTIDCPQLFVSLVSIQNAILLYFQFDKSLVLIFSIHLRNPSKSKM